MALYSGFDQYNHLSELALPLDTQAGVLSPASRRGLVLTNMGITATLAQINVLAGVTAGTVLASKAVVVDANKDVGVFRNMRAVRYLDQSGAAFSDATAGNITLTAAQVLGGTVVRDPNGAGRTDTLPTAALLVAALPGAQVGDIIELTIVNGADAAETITIAAGAGGAFDANQTAASRVIIQNTSKTARIRLTNVTASSEAYVVYL